MKIGEILRRQGRSLSFEFFPPKTQAGEKTLFETIEQLSLFKPDYVSVTYGAGGSTKEGTKNVVSRIVSETQLAVMPHLTCIGESRRGIFRMLKDYQKMGVENILALRGDPPMGAAEMPEVEDGFEYAKDLVKFLSPFRSFSIGVAVYPEGHLESPNLEKDTIYTKKKIEAGADFAITQMFFDNQFFYDLLERAKKAGISIPIIAGIMPITNFEKTKQFARMCGATIPSKLNQTMAKVKHSLEETKRIGIDYAIRQCEDLLKNGVSYFHFYTLNHYEPVSEILNSIL